MPKILFAAIFTVIILASGCQKTQDYFEFALTIVDQHGNAVGGAQVEGYIKPVGPNGLGNYELKETSLSDAFGKVNIKIDKESAFGFRFDISKGAHFQSSHEIISDDVPVTKPYVSDLVLDSQSWFQLNIKNNTGAVAVFWNTISDAPTCETCCVEVPGQHVLQGSNVDTSFICTLYGDQNFRLEGKYTDAQIVVHAFDHTLFAPAGDTLVFDLVY
ncbi:MAG: hypothetical protein ACI85F_000368 [Bacteroidia bacterium]|jgi:hypothetical protein